MAGCVLGRRTGFEFVMTQTGQHDDTPGKPEGRRAVQLKLTIEGGKLARRVRCATAYCAAIRGVQTVLLVLIILAAHGQRAGPLPEIKAETLAGTKTRGLKIAT